MSALPFAAFVAAASMAGAAPSVASAAEAAGPDNVQLVSVFAKPVVAKPYATAAENERSLCTPEPAGRRIYGTDNPFVPTSPIQAVRASGYPASVAGGYPGTANYTGPNFPSRDNLVPALQAGASNDLCFGFTLTPNLQPDMMRGPSTPSATGKRISDDPPGTAVADTAVGYEPAESGSTLKTGAGIDNDDLKTVSIDMPQGFLGDPDGSPTCSDADFKLELYVTDTCSTDAQLGTAYLRASFWLQLKSTSNPLLLHYANGGAPENVGGDPRGLTNGGAVYNLEHGPNELGKLGVVIQPAFAIAPAKFIVRLQLAPDGSGRVRTVVENAPRNVYPDSSVIPAGQPNAGQLKPNPTALPLYLESIGIRAWGKKADHGSLSQDFAEWGTQCTSPISAKVSVETYKGKTSSMGSDPVTLTGCDQLPFLPSVSIETSERRPAVPTAATIKVGLGQTSSGLKSALLKDATVTLPTGFELGAQAGSGPNGLPLCTAAQFGYDTQDKPNACPAATKTGDLSIITPLQTRPFVGAIYLGEQPAVGELPALYLEASPQGATSADAPRIKLKGQVSVDAEGRITTTFKDNPQLRFSELRLTFPGGDNALFVTPRACGVAKGTSTFVSYASETPVNVESSLDINEDCDTPAFAPTFSMTAADSAVGISSPTTVALGRADRSPWLKDFKVSLPSGFLADLNIVTECSMTQANAGSCPESSRMGTVTTTAGVGPKPLTLSGQMYFTERVSGAVAGAVIIVRAKIGDIDLGDVVVPARIDLRPTDAGLELTTTAPTRFKGLALNLRTFSVALDRPGFPLNPTACGPLPATAALVADNGAPATVTTSISYTGCAAKPLGTTITPKLVGDLKASSHPEVQVSVAMRPGDTNLKSTTVMLPAGVAAYLPNLQNLCSLEAFNAAACPEATKVGNVSVNVSITSETIPGDIYLVKTQGEPLPALGLNITGRYAQRLMAQVRIDPKTARLITAFEAIPDLPITKLQLTVSGGAKSPITVSDKVCAAPSTWESTFGGQGGQSTKVTTPFNCSTPVAAAPKVSWSRKSGIKLTFTAPAGKTVKSYKITMPSGFKIKTSKSSVKKYLKVTAKGGKLKTKISSKSLAVVASGAGPTSMTLTLKPKGYSLPKSKAYKKGLTKNKKLKLKLRGVTSDGKVAASTTTVKTS